MLLISQLYALLCHNYYEQFLLPFLAECTVMCMYVSQIRHVSSLLELSLTHDNPSLWLAMLAWLDHVLVLDCFEAWH